ncbi:hypothetical protein DFH27DRAFT_564261 [Peziza echinospora]|nr:hypothetical protein DFH27DRAFT_564261 [Peziza echinospora]
MQSFKDFVHDVREAKEAAAGHNLLPRSDAGDRPPTSPAADPATSSEAIPVPPNPPASSIATTTVTTSGLPGDAHVHVVQQAFVPSHLPPPPPRDLPHGWTARFDESTKKYAYSEGLTGKEQWDFPTDTRNLSQLPSTLLHHVRGPSSDGMRVTELPAYVPAEHPPLSAGFEKPVFAELEVDVKGKGKGKAT